ncbi:MAG: AraC family transcriptional regulator [Eubacteriales bacterium]|nr:AraC family transcriptional regulator [Eubacteriales bacterium]
MEEQREASGFREAVPHMTKARPYSVHRSLFGPGGGRALYLHWHPEIELYYLEAGEVEFFVEERRFILKAGEAVLVPPNCLHAADAGSDISGAFRALVFSVDFVVNPADAALFARYMQPLLRRGRECCLCLTEEEEWQRETLADLRRIFALADRREDEGLAIGGLTAVIWQQLYDRHFSAFSVPEEQTSAVRGLRRAADFIQAHYWEDITLAMLAEAAHVSEGQLCRIFKRAAGCTPFFWLKRYRIQKSCFWLSDSDKKIAEIGTLCGFNNISYFNREFLKLMKMTPSEYRKICKNSLTKRVNDDNIVPESI